MTVYADTPRWARYGMTWGHLISDTSLEELHALARRAGLPGRSFDLDHYDWEAGARRALAAAGTVFVGNGELTRILLASGLRIPAARRPDARRARAEDAARELGLGRTPLDLITGPLGHVDPLPERAGAFRVSRDDPARPPRVEAHDAAGRRAAAAFVEHADRLSHAAGRGAWIGQVLDVADGSGE
ncbi:DUF4031 domain-containing protein [Brachybacterium huguangmaarense]|uniref:DUF4031 domain-containing protein n=1 Tax=Brachybacterium huguangmaarense TaxID=1652028 RepID=A0ABY6G1V3_9MICO|nr:DUF4031 domain-containing protein [Brachybacterium huguangmaarense]UYG17182.1 DUF4031 domain-containing protein [Brachybacterium huguangmaarense]